MSPLGRSIRRNRYIDTAQKEQLASSRRRRRHNAVELSTAALCTTTDFMRPKNPQEGRPRPESGEPSSGLCVRLWDGSQYTFESSLGAIRAKKLISRSISSPGRTQPQRQASYIKIYHSFAHGVVTAHSSLKGCCHSPCNRECAAVMMLKYLL